MAVWPPLKPTHNLPPTNPQSGIEPPLRWPASVNAREALRWRSQADATHEVTSSSTRQVVSQAIATGVLAPTLGCHTVPPCHANDIALMQYLLLGPWTSKNIVHVLLFIAQCLIRKWHLFYPHSLIYITYFSNKKGLLIMALGLFACFFAHVPRTVYSLPSKNVLTFGWRVRTSELFQWWWLAFGRRCFSYGDFLNLEPAPPPHFSIDMYLNIC